jgi:penicillin-binding protein 1A
VRAVVDRHLERVRIFFGRIWAKAKLIPLKIWILFGTGSFALIVIASSILFFLMVRNGHFGPLPTYGDLKTIQNNIASELYSSDEKLLGKYFIQERTHVSLENISPLLIDALLSTEDIRFYNHNGIDYKSLGRVFVKSILLQRESSGGGSTITQQLAKNLFPRRNHGVLTMPVIKVKESIIARRLESIYAKDEILELYLNTVPFGDNAYGIETAAERYFSTDPYNLTIPQSAMLVGMLKATYNYNPRINPESAIARRNLVLSQMKKYGYLSESRADSLRNTPLGLDYTNQSHSEGLAAYFREQVRVELAGMLRSIERPNGGNYNLYTDGLRIYTTIDSRMQTYAEEAVKEHMGRLQKTFNSHWGNTPPWHRNNEIVMSAMYRSEKYKKLRAQGLSDEEIKKEFEEVKPMKLFTWEGEIEKELSSLDSVKHYLNFLNTGFLVMDTHSGDIKAWVGGINHKYFKYDHVNLNTKRQVGSTFKPIVYAAAIEQGMDPCEYHSNEQRVYAEYEDWSPRNSDGIYHGYYSMQGALTQSINTISVDLILQAGINNTVKTAQAFGIKSKLEPAPAIALGAASISLTEMVTAYCAFANNGVTVSPRYITRIETKTGEVIYENEPKNPGTRAISERTAEMMIRMMQSVVNQGTAARLRFIYGLYNDIAGKTGTSQNNADGWFIGITPSLTAGAWVGAADPRIHFRSLDLGQGASTAMPIYGLFMQKLMKDPAFKNISSERFPSPSPEVIAALDCEPYKTVEPGVIQILDDLLKRSERERRSPPRYPPKKQEQERKRNLFDRIFRR